MSEESNLVPASRLIRWGVLGALILLAVGLYFRDGIQVPVFGTVPTAASGR